MKLKLDSKPYSDTLHTKCQLIKSRRDKKKRGGGMENQVGQTDGLTKRQTGQMDGQSVLLIGN